MKKKLIVLVLLSCITKGWGQEIITINPFGNDSEIRNIKIGKTVKFEIENVNTFKINGFTSSKPLNIDFEIPAIFNDLIQPKTAEDSLTSDANLSGELDKIITNLSLKSFTTSTTKNDLIDLKKKYENERLKENESNFITEFSSFISNFNSIHQQIELESKLVSQISDSIFINDKVTLISNVTNYYQAVYGNKKALEANKETENKLNALMINYSKIVKLYDELNKTLEKDSVSVTGKLISEDEKTILKVTEAYIHQNRKKYFSEEMAFVKKTYQTLIEVKNRNEIIAKAQAGIALSEKIVKATFKVYTDAEQLNDDQVTITPKLKYANGTIAHEFKPITLSSYGGWKVNFSSGYLLSFVGDDSYKTYKDVSGATIGVSQTNQDKVTHALGGLAHVYPRWIYGPQIGLSAGVSLATSGNLGFYGGLSFFFLEKNRLVFTGGYSFTKIKKLNTSNLTFVSDDKYTFINTIDTEINYDEVYQGALFIGITYNLSK